ncbi:MAG: arsenate reductase ArsC [Methylococcales symbiont of Iophon sp. n. MRB-2018]|nr:MAG: arsenate reductase ArsC [Methylococcales symbiont of Iophon sp. n. MRB-2018]KAF3979266.1 MAG: arsenate reductase ArsC [Methylococcales symbiont of Iophon sp. n. MRB-2018]
MLNVFVICTGNSCRSVMAEALFNHLAQDRIQAFSAGSHPVGKINTAALATLKRHHFPAGDYQSQSWEDYEDQVMDIVITVCDNAAAEPCPIYLSNAIKAHWGVSDPGHTQGTEAEIISAFEQTFAILKQRIEAMLALPLEILSTEQLSAELNLIGKRFDPTTKD